MEIRDILAVSADIVGLISAVAAVIAAIKANQINRKLEIERERGDQQIEIILQNGRNTIDLPSPIRRKDLSRAELLGRIGMIKPEKRFQLESLNTEKFFKDLDAVVNSSDQKILTISLTDSDYNQFIT